MFERSGAKALKVLIGSFDDKPLEGFERFEGEGSADVAKRAIEYTIREWRECDIIENVLGSEVNERERERGKERGRGVTR